MPLYIVCTVAIYRHISGNQSQKQKHILPSCLLAPPCLCPLSASLPPPSLFLHLPSLLLLLRRAYFDPSSSKCKVTSEWRGEKLVGSSMPRRLNQKRSSHFTDVPSYRPGVIVPLLPRHAPIYTPFHHMIL